MPCRSRSPVAEGVVLSGRRVLVVEDEMLVAMMIEDMLADLGCALVGPAARVDHALALTGETGIDIAILDVNLHGEQSWAVADVLAARGVPFVFATGYGNAGVPDAYGGVPVLTKPFRMDDLEHALITALQQA